MTFSRGQRTVTIGGQSVPVRLTLGALAEVEEALGADTLSDLARILMNPSAQQILAVLGVLVRHGGAEGWAERIGVGDIHLSEVLKTVADLFRELMGADLPGKPTPPGTDGAHG